MGERYTPKKIESVWQKYWSEEGVFQVDAHSDTPKRYVLDMFPYPSGAGLHVGHPKGYIATDVYARYSMMRGYQVLHPMGWDAFGLPAENYAIKNKVHPRVSVKENIDRFKEQLTKIGFTYDWGREINTTDPEYYKWTQWIFLQLYKKGLAYESYEPINWCPSCMTGLAMEDLEGGACERCGSQVEKKPMRQWVLKITEYADRLLEGLDDVEWPESIKESQRHWIGRSVGARLSFAIKDMDISVDVFTTRPDTLFGATYLVLAPEHDIVRDLLEKGVVQNAEDVEAYRKQASQKSEIERLAEEKEKTGVCLQGVHVLHPATGEELSVWIADYVLADYGTGAIMAVPAHDVRDFAFAHTYDLPVIQVISSDTSEDVYTGEGVLVHSGEFDGMHSREAKDAIVAFVGGAKDVKYKMRDWVFSRQRYWGEPIPIVHCDTCGTVPVPEEQLPVVLPDVEHYEPTGTGESPLAAIDDWVHTSCPSCGEDAKRETNTMPQWAGSSWYYLRYIDPRNNKAFVHSDKEKYWMPVDMYVGGAEHATRHLIYARFWHKALYDLGHVSTSEPFMRLQHVGLVLAEDGRKMSKRFGNVINPDDIVEQYGADTLRVYEMFMGPFSQSVAWSMEGIAGPRRFLDRVWRLVLGSVVEGETDSELTSRMHRTIRQVTNDTEQFKFNTAISSLMELMNVLESRNSVSREVAETLLLLLAPYAPHIAEELWSRIGNTSSIMHAQWPSYDESLLADADVTIAVQVNGKVRGQVEASAGASQEDVLRAAYNLPNVVKYVEGASPEKVIYVQDRILNIVVHG